MELFYEDEAMNQSLQKKYPEYKNLNLTWLEHANAMLQFSIWCALETQGLGANIQHYNFIIEEKVKEAFQIPENWKLIAQMPFGKIGNMPEEEEKVDLNKRIIVIKE